MFHHKVLSYDHFPGGNFLDLGSGLGRACVSWALLVLGNPVAQQFLAIGASREKNGFMTINIPWCWMSMLNMNGIPQEYDL